MRVLQLALVLLLETAAARVVKFAPSSRPETNYHHLGQSNATSDAASGLARRLDPVPGVHWTLHSTCLNDEHKRDAVISAVIAAKSRSQLAVDRLGEWRDDAQKIDQLALLFPENQDSQISFDQAIKIFSGIANIEGPIGPPTYSDSDEWADLATDNENHWKNIVFYCNPALLQMQQNENHVHLGLHWYDQAQKQWIKDDHSLVQMQNDINKNDFVNRENALQAVTLISAGDSSTPPPHRRVIPAAITLHPLYLNDLRDPARDDKYEIMAEEEINKLAESLNHAAHKPDHAGSEVPISFLTDGLTSLIHHELFHTPGLGALIDIKGPSGSDDNSWAKMVADSDMDAPGWYAIMGLLIELVDRESRSLRRGF